MQVEFDWKVNVGQVVEVIGLLLSLLMLHTANTRRLVKIETRLDLLWRQFLRSLPKAQRDDVEEEN